MPANVYEQHVQAYKKDSRTPCIFGLRCYQKNPVHHARYKHPPKKPQESNVKKIEKVNAGRKRTFSHCDYEATGSTELPHIKLRKNVETQTKVGTHSMSPSPPPNVVNNGDSNAESDRLEKSPNVDSLLIGHSKTVVKNGNTLVCFLETTVMDEDIKGSKIPAENRYAPASPLETAETDMKIEDPKISSENGDDSASSLETAVTDAKIKDSKNLAANEHTQASSSEAAATFVKQENEETEAKSKDSDGSGSQCTSEFQKTFPLFLPKPDIYHEKIINDLFLVKMPKDFYKFYELCTLMSPKNPLNAFRRANLQLVGPYDVLAGKITTTQQEDPEKFLRHWRYYYDPPEFQTVFRVTITNSKHRDYGLHYGYWRDDSKELPIFVAQNFGSRPNVIDVVGVNIFGAVATHLNDRLYIGGLIKDEVLERLLKKTRAFAKENGITLAKNSPEIRRRERRIVARTFHHAGIVVPYDKKTKLGYRPLAASENFLLKILRLIDETDSDEKRVQELSSIDEVVRQATIAADECDFGTPLELGHNLFYSGVERIEQVGWRMLIMAYNLLHQDAFAQIAQAHKKYRQKDCNLLSVL